MLPVLRLPSISTTQRERERVQTARSASASLCAVAHQIVCDAPCSCSQSSVCDQIEKYLKATHVECHCDARIPYHSSAQQNESSSIGRKESVHNGRAASGKHRQCSWENKRRNSQQAERLHQMKISCCIHLLLLLL